MHVRLGCPHVFLSRYEFGWTGLLQAFVAPGFSNPSNMHATRSCATNYLCQADHDDLRVLEIYACWEST
jgi:hypothetical protein